MRILVAEDDRVTRRSLERQVERLGYDVVGAADGVEAWERIQREEFDIVLTDWDMPRMDGRALVERIRGRDRPGYVYVIMLTARTETADLVEGIEAGADDFVSKPFDRNELRARLRAGERVIELERSLAARNNELREANEAVRQERDRSDSLLLNILPERVAEDLKQTGRTTPQLFDGVTALFSDFVGFTSLSQGVSPETLIVELNELFTAFDQIAEANGCERIKTIGDAYLAVCGMPNPDASHARNIVRTALGMVEYLRERNTRSERKWELRVGIHSGPVIGAVVGIKKFIYDVFGDTINTASRMENASEPMQINVSEATYRQVKEAFRFVQRPAREIKGKGVMQMYFVESER